MSREIIERNKKSIQRFKDCINTNDRNLANELIDSKAEFASLTSPELLYGGDGYLSVVEFMRKSFSDIHWEIVDLAADEMMKRKSLSVGFVPVRMTVNLWVYRQLVKNSRSAA